MNAFTTSVSLALADYFLLSGVLLMLTLVVLALLKQPAQRLAVTKSTLVALLLLVALCAAPGWSLIHLLATEQPQPNGSPVLAQPLEPIAALPLPTTPLADNLAPIPAPQPIAPLTAPRTEILADISWPAAALLAFGAGTACIAIWLCLGAIAARRLVRSAQPAPAELVMLMAEVAGNQPPLPPGEAASYRAGEGNPNEGIERVRVRLLVSNRIDVAVAIGTLRPAIVLPQSLVEAHSPLSAPGSPLRTILAHEVAHITNHDLAWLAVSRALLILLWPQPIFWLLRRRMRLDQEALADAAAAELTSRHMVAEQLVAWARNLPARPAPRLSAAVGLWEGPSQLRQRIALLLDEHFTVLQHTSRRLRLSIAFAAAAAAIFLSLVTLEPGRSQSPRDGQSELSAADAEEVAAAIRTLRETEGIGTQTSTRIPPIGRAIVADDWASEIRTLSEIGRPAVPAIIAALDEEHRDHAISKFAFTLRAIGDPRAVPVLIRAVPRTLLPSRSDYGLRIEDSDLLRFMQEHDLTPTDSQDDGFDYGRAFREVTGALQKLTGVDQNDKDLNWVHLGETDAQRRLQRRLFHQLAERWADWWSKNWQKFGVDEQYTAVNLPAFADDAPAANRPTKSLAVGAKLGLISSADEWIVESAQESAKRCFVDLDTARVGDWPTELPTVDQIDTASEQVLSWAREQGFDLLGISYQPPGYDAPLYCLQPLDLKAWQITPNEQRDLQRAINGENAYPLTRPVEQLVPRKESYKGPNKYQLGGTAFLFLTREGTAGLLRMTAQVTDTNVQIGKPSTPADQYSPVGFYRGAKISFAFIADKDDPQNANRVIHVTQFNDSDAFPPARFGGSVDMATRPPLPRPEPNTILGRTQDENGQPIADAEVFLFRVNRHDSTRKLVAEKTSDADGRFRFDNVIDIAQEFPGGKFPPLLEPMTDQLLQVAVRSTGRVSEVWLGLPQRVAQRGEIAMFKLPLAATLRGRVTDLDGKPVAGALVTIGSTSFNRWEFMKAARTDADGNYTINDVAPFDMQKYRQQQAELQRRMEERSRSGNNGSTADYVYFAPPVLAVEHPDFAVKKTDYETIPGTKNIQLEPAAILVGRVVFGDSGKPAANVLVHAVTSQPNDNELKVLGSFSILYDRHEAQVRTDAEGRYRFTTLPAGNYDLWAETNDWVNVGAEHTLASTERPTTVPDLVFTKGSLVKIRLVDSKTREPIEVEPGEFASIALRVPSPPMSRPVYLQPVMANADGKFEVRALPGKNLMFVGSFESGGERKWYGTTNAGEMPIEVDVADSQTIDIDVPVVDAKEAQAKAEVAGVFIPFGATITQKPAQKNEDQKSDTSETPKNPSEKDGVNQPVDAATKVATADESKPNFFSGQCVDESGQPLAGVEVLLLRLVARNAKPVVATQKTGADGRFIFDVSDILKEHFPDGKLPPEDDPSASHASLAVVTRAAGRATSQVFFSPRQIATEGVNCYFKIGPAVKLSGRVTGPDGKPVEGATVAVGGAAAAIGAQTAITDAEGRYHIDDLFRYDPDMEFDERMEFAFNEATSKGFNAHAIAMDSQLDTLHVSHPQFAFKRVNFFSAPDERNIELKPAAVIAGRVVYADTQQPAAGVEVGLMVSNLTNAEWKTRGSQGKFDPEDDLNYSRNEKTDADGRYRFANLPAHLYDVWAKGTDGPTFGARRLEATANEVTKVPDIVLTATIAPEPSAAEAAPKTAPSELSGTVLGPDGKPLAGVTVDAWTWYSGNETETDEQGHFHLQGFEPNSEVEVELRKEGYGPRYFVNQRSGTLDWSIQMDNRTFLEGQLTDRQGETVADAVIRAERGPFENEHVVIGEVATETRTDEKGHYRLYLEPHTYAIKIRVPNRGVARYEAQRIARGEQKQFDIRLQEGLTFRANVVNSVTSEPVEGIMLWNWRLKGIEGASNAEGLLEIPGLFPGKLEFNVTTVGVDRMRTSVAGDYARWWSEEAVHEHQRELHLDEYGFQRNFDSLEFNVAAEADAVTIYVEPCVTISGRVTDPDGRPVAGATVAPAKTGSGNSLTGDTRFSYETKEDGTFEMKLPASGVAEYNLIAHDGKFGQWRTWANGGGKPFSTEPGDHVQNVELRLTRPATIRGRVTTDGNTPAAGKEVRAADVENHGNRYYLPTTKTDAEGRFELKFVAPGKQRIQVDPFRLDPSEAPAGTSTVVEVKEGDTIEEVHIGQ